MGDFHTKCRIENPVERGKSALVSKVLIDTGSEYTWIPESILKKISIKRKKKDLQFIMVNGRIVTRSVGFAIIRIGKSFTIDEVVFGEAGDLLLLGARTLEGMALTVDPRRRKLVASGPLPAAANDKCHKMAEMRKQFA